VLGIGAVTEALSPDGKTIATLQKGCLGFFRTDGALAGYVRCETKTSPAGLVWADKDTLAILRSDKVADKLVLTLSFVKSNGSIAKTVSLPEMDAGDDADSGQLALSPDGRYIVVCFEKGTYFLDSGGTLLTAWTGGDKDVLAQPTFTPDGKRVAFKLLHKGEGDVARVTAIAFFSPAGQELHRVNLPLPPAPATRPAATTLVPVGKPAATTAPILELPPLRVEAPPMVTETPTTAATSRPAPASAPAVELNPEQKKALEELAPELP
jgi:hypothetical protein